MGHWINIQTGTTRDCHMVVPTTWNLGPRSADGEDGAPSPLEQVLVGVPVEVLRVVHSFITCVACGVHVIDPDSNPVYKFKVL